MANHANRNLCPDAELLLLTSAAGGNGARAMHDLDGALTRYPNDARLHFLRGSLLAGRQDFDAAKIAMRQAVDLAPDYAVARFQLGFLLFTSGDIYAAQETWGPLHSLPPGHYLRLFVDGLCHLIRDEFKEAVQALRDGIAKNRENPPMNRDMQMIVDEIGRKSDVASRDPQSSVELLLQQSALRPTRH